MQELGLAESLLSFSTIQPLACHLSEPDGGLDTDYVPELERLLRCIGMPFQSLPDAKLPVIFIESHGVGYDWGNGSTKSPLRPAGGWRQRSTDTVDQVHLAALACSDSYWNVMPERFKSVSALSKWVPELFLVECVWEIPRHRKYLSERVWAIYSSARSFDARAELAMHRVTTSIDADAAAGYLESAQQTAAHIGAVYFDYGFGDSPFVDEPILDKAWRRGIYDEGIAQSIEAAADADREHGHEREAESA
jgi:hypothetical protein